MHMSTKACALIDFSTSCICRKIILLLTPESVYHHSLHWKCLQTHHFSLTCVVSHYFNEHHNVLSIVIKMNEYKYGNGSLVSQLERDQLLLLLLHVGEMH